MKFFLATGEALDLSELVGSELLVEWQDPAVQWEGGADDLPESQPWRTRGILLGVRDGKAGQELGLAADDRALDGIWRAATAIPAALITKINRLAVADEYFPTRSA